MPKPISAKQFLTKHVSHKDHVLLVNPPVVETRYSWVRWNQPLDLLRIGAHLRSTVQCKVELLDFMKPSSDGTVLEEFEPMDRRYRHRGDERYPMRRFGKRHDEFRKWIYERRSQNPQALPTQVWVTSLCWYWFGSVIEMCRVVRDVLPSAQVVLVGHYPGLRPDLAANCDVDAVVRDGLDLAPALPAFDLYGKELPPFLALQSAAPEVALETVRFGLARKILNYTFYEEDVLADGGDVLAAVIDGAVELDKRVKFHLICGLHPRRIDARTARVIARREFASLNFEEADDGGELDVDACAATRRYLTEAGIKWPDDRVRGFVWIGRPKDEVEILVERSFRVLDSFGGLILKPYTPLPNSEEHNRYRKQLDKLDLADWSPHFFPFAEVNGITCGEYHDLYRMAAFLNEKVRSRSFDFLQGTLGAGLLRSSLERKVWNLAPSPLRVVS